MIIEVMAAFLTAISFGVLFNIKGKRLIAAGIGGGLSWFIYKFCLSYTGVESSSYFMAAICFSIYCEICARVCKTPATTLTVCCLIPLVPGYGIYNTMYEFLIGDYLKAIEYGIDTLVIAGSLALGIIFISTIFRNFKFHKILENIVNGIKNINSKDKTLKIYE
ncbi:threonine/serine exporter family protein [Romboutsia sp.]|uniref:threonine/serine exporter family protein n=1 Tax=Romboutsia sp. TaxID=1965302 RepID=UPI002B89B4EB|nr:threonine/serine exporter family protein [Romboutsia sp.]HSQ89956.1 threonine/serine exporter family protein [Romboutsia sp.]